MQEQCSEKAAHIVNPDSFQQVQAELFLLRRQLFLAEIRDAEAEYESDWAHRFYDVEGLLDDLKR